MNVPVEMTLNHTPSLRHRAFALLCAALVLVLGVLAVCPAAHALFHHDAADGDHDCIVTDFLHGSAPPLDTTPLVAEPIPRGADVAHVFATSFAPSFPAFLHPPTCGPPSV